jgi:hypothetical protein
MSIIKKFEESKQRNLLIPLWIRLTFILGPLLLGIYWWYTFTGLYRWITNLQLYLFGQYYEIYGGLVTLIILFAPALGILNMIGLKYSPGTEVKEKKALSLVDKINIVSKTKPFLLKIYILTLALGAMGFIMGCYFFIIYGQISRIPIAIDIETSTLVKDKTTEYITAVTRLQCEHTLIIEKNKSGSSSSTLYIPVSDANGKFKNIFLEAITYNKELDCKDSLASLKGIIRPGGLPGLIRDRYMEAGVLDENKDYSIIEYNADPARNAEFGDAMFILSLVSLLIFLALELTVKPFANKHF